MTHVTHPRRQAQAHGRVTHRVLWSGGQIKDGWIDDEGRGPEECERQLRGKGIDVTERHADPVKFIGWEGLKALLEAEEQATGLDEAA